MKINDGTKIVLYVLQLCSFNTLSYPDNPSIDR